VKAMNRRTLRRFSAITGIIALGGLTSASPGFAADGSGSGNVDVVNTETVKVYMSADGDIQSKRVYEQLALTGHGSVDLKNPVSTDGLRNLDGFGGFTVKNGEQIAKTTVDGTKHYRSVSNYDGTLPVTISTRYTLNGRHVGPHDIVGKSGKLEVQFVVKNKTTKKQDVTVSDGSGGTVTKTVDVPVPMVGSLTTTAPKNFSNVDPGGASTAGDGTGGTTMSYTMTLFPPLGTDTATLGYTADITDGVVPRVDVALLPVDPLASPTFKAAGDSYKGGAETGAQLVTGAGVIDTNLLKLRDGAATLLAGLIKLSDGADQLNAGLANDAAPGAKKLATGADELSDGLVRLHGGAGQLSDGAKTARAGSVALDAGAAQLAAGLKSAEAKAPALITGLGDVRAGLVLVNGGLTTMYNQVGGIPAQAQPLFDGIQQMINGIGTKTTANTLLYGVNAVRAGLDGALPKIQTMADGVYNTDPAAPGAYQKLGCAVTVLNALKSGTIAPGSDPIAGSTNGCFKSATNPTATVPPLLPLSAVDASDGLTPAEYQTLTLSSIITGLTDGQAQLATSGGAINDTTLYGGLRTLLGQLNHFPTSASDAPGAVVALAGIQCGLDNTSLDGITLPNGLSADLVCKTVTPGGAKLPGLKQGLQGVSGGIDLLVQGIVDAIHAGIGQTTDMPVDQTLRGGVNGLIGGIDLLGAGGSTLVDGLGQLSTGAQQLSAGTGQLSSGLGDLSAGANKLAAGATDASDGGQQVADGANKLSTGLTDATDGSGQISDGLKTAAAGAPQLVDGAGRLSKEGMGQLISAGKDTAVNYGTLYAVIKAGSERAQTSAMAYGAPAGAEGLTAYSFTITGEDGEGDRNVARGLGGLALLGLGAGAVVLRRRMI
jgi:putative membrane protein